MSEKKHSADLESFREDGEIHAGSVWLALPQLKFTGTSPLVLSRSVVEQMLSIVDVMGFLGKPRKNPS
jgi:hypothetical protein